VIIPAPAVESKFAELTAPLEAEFAGAAKSVPRRDGKKRGARKNPAPIR